MKASQSISQPRTDMTSSYPTQTSPARASIQIPPPVMTQGDFVVESDVDFSPSVGTIPLHPVPFSHDGGATLDWAGSASEDEKPEKRWALHMNRRKTKDRSSGPSSRTVVEKQDSLFADKLTLIKNKAKSDTLRKAAITSNQLRRRYSILLTPSPAVPVSILDVARWYDKQEPTMKASLEKAEPLTWLKHLWDKGGRKTLRSPRTLSAKIIEEYVKAHTTPQAMETIPEDEIAPEASSIMVSYPESKSPTSTSILEPSISRNRSSYDTQVSFEPVVDSGRDSLGSRPSSEGFTRYWRQSLPNGTDSTRSSIYSNMFSGVSPTNSRLHLRDITKRVRRRGHGSEEALSSAQESISGQSASEDGHGRTGQAPDVSVPELRTQDDSATAAEQRSALHVASVSVDQSQLTEIPAENSWQRDDAEEPTAKREDFSAQDVSSSIPKNARCIRKRLSLPSSGLRLLREHEKRQREEVDEENEKREYERKAQILEDTVSHNSRTRRLLQRVATCIREYDSVQSSLSSVLGMPYPKVPHEMLEAFTYDPCAVTGVTRSLKGWRAVEDIHDRIHRQRKTLRTFGPAFSTDSISSSPGSTPRNIFDDPIASLMQSLKELEKHRQLIVRQAEKVIETLAGVKNVHSDVKREYNETLAHTSLVYPELSQIAVLEGNYRNHYQQFWDLSLDALTLLLDTVTPFWRNYGKVIGEDVQDFLIIPWYRNEFTGEPKRYPIKAFPQRSFRHWIGLTCLSFLSCCITLLQARAAVTLTVNCNLPWITHSGLRYLFFPLYLIGLLIQWCAVLVEGSIVVAQWGVVVWWMGWAVNIFT
ncbi:hypothetical protein BKA93DRAFT_40151 [Sparassis latifolia]